VAQEAKNVVIRRPSPPVPGGGRERFGGTKGQGSTTAISARTGWEYEHDETDEQIDAIEELILKVRKENGVTQGCSPALKGAVVSWNSSTDDGDGDIIVGMTWAVPGDGEVNLGSRGILEGHVWATQKYTIAPDGTVTEGEVE